MKTKTGWIQWTNTDQQWVNAYIANPSTDTALDTFMASLAALSSATLSKVSYVLTDRPTISPGTEGEYGLQYFLAVRLKSASSPTKYHEIQIFAPIDSIMEEVQSQNGKYQKRIKQANGEAVATAYSTLSGETHTYETGWLCVRE